MTERKYRAVTFFLGKIPNAEMRRACVLDLTCLVSFSSCNDLSQPVERVHFCCSQIPGRAHSALSFSPQSAVFSGVTHKAVRTSAIRQLAHLAVVSVLRDASSARREPEQRLFVFGTVYV